MTVGCARSTTSCVTRVSPQGLLTHSLTHDACGNARSATTASDLWNLLCYDKGKTVQYDWVNCTCSAALTDLNRCQTLNGTLLLQSAESFVTFQTQEDLQFKINHWRSVALLTLSIECSGRAITCLLLDCKDAIEREWRPYCKKWNKVMLLNQTILHWMSIKGFDFFIWFLWIEKGISLWLKN